MRYGGARSGKLVVPYFGIRGGGGIDVCQFKNYKCDCSIISYYDEGSMAVSHRERWENGVEF